MASSMVEPAGELQRRHKAARPGFRFPVLPDDIAQRRQVGALAIDLLGGPAAAGQRCCSPLVVGGLEVPATARTVDLAVVR